MNSLVGQAFGRLTVLRWVPGSRATNRGFWECHCECGKTVRAFTGDLLSGRVVSCGCKKAERIAAFRYRHGHASEAGSSRTYRSWQAMLTRCTNPRRRGWENYGGRGIKVCIRWMVFDNFLADMGERPAGMSLDRINVDGDYEPGNCRWATRTEQAFNKRNSRVYRGLPPTRRTLRRAALLEEPSSHDVQALLDDRSVYGCALQERADLTAEELSHDVQARLDYASHR